MMLFAKETPLPHAEQLPALTLAWVGDAVYELWVRTALLEEETTAKVLSRKAVGQVNHLVQSRLLGLIEADLTPLEQQVLRRGRNTHGSIPKNGSVQDYRRATGLEALIGYLYLSGNEDRLRALLSQMQKGAGE